MSSESPRIAFHFLPGNLPLSNGVSGIPELDDVLFGPMSFGPPAGDATIDATPEKQTSYIWDMSHSVEEIFEDLHACCATQAPSHPLALPERPFYPFDPAEVADTPDVVMSEAFDTPSVASVPPAAWQEIEESDESSSEYSESDDDIFRSDSYYDPIDMCTLPQSSPLSLAGYSTPPSSPSPSLASTSSPITLTLSSPFPLAESQTPVVSSFSPSPDLTIAAAADQNLPPPADSANVPSRFWYLLHLGCKRHGARVHCYKCSRTTKRFADMERHVLIHNRAECEVKCEGCPWSFARCDALERHLKSPSRPDGKRHISPARRAFLAIFETLEEVVSKRAACDYANRKAVERLNKELAHMFESHFKAHEA
ncbi:C2H2-type domain-containing protein [Mycena sanguinolenta]|uniref:C2H2-type domain-containing protein n=1 Tax=Mycena sanguinolenta TaxID=230812 RepID=A0A8H6ZE01_9AGAR|nr:C2H2-type domain-containing protein [Mycena sanguinolenta]